jgi:deazaflavin-dependent oxidoreductase (nitroreductase family)
MSEPAAKKPRTPPHWFMYAFWHAHRWVYRLTGGRFGLRRPKPGGWGMMRLTTIGRRSGQEHNVVVGYFEDDTKLVTLAMNGWGEGDPAWWLNLQAHPEIQVDLTDGSRLVTAREANGEERERLWDRWLAIDETMDAQAAHRSTHTAVVILEPRPASSG